MKRNIMLIITGNNYPEGDAGSVRQHAFCKIFQMLGYEPFVIGMGKATGFQEQTHDGVRYISLRYRQKHIVCRIWGRIAFLHHLQPVVRKISPQQIAGILVVSGGNSVFKWVESFGAEHGIPLYHDSVEWYSPEEFTHREKARAYRANDTLNRSIIQKNWRVIAISKYLEQHFQKQCEAVVRIPVIMDIKRIRSRITANESYGKIRFAYVGAPAKKDFLVEVIHGFALLSQEEKAKIELHIVGVNKDKLLSMCGVHEEDIAALGSSLIIHGRLPRNEALQWVVDADYTLLLRDETLRYAKAGFPTKIVESLAHGTPPVCNYSSDLHEYLSDEENAFIIPGHSAEDVRNTVARIIRRHPDIGSQMRINARKTAEACFDLQNFVSTMRSIIKE